ncbi:hypothetical protein P170DRAFT_250520 [Aspergillus steynii IBT 23096]|uniref:Uncharacterized protein n=1 Tax=Aspergillus steynii IBT 23096 TaxID=1392250 RepID=A0A2I2FYM1_9EURO|nr:uncharacterized protein P170DRAFT_250520 [Aspergillus steynii IBT 23096]PLB45718.1 hypothetical protein P170DRAFT_250520 [Aspergillus steynii IBT 23096]
MAVELGFCLFLDFKLSFLRVDIPSSEKPQEHRDTGEPSATCSTAFRTLSRLGSPLFPVSAVSICCVLLSTFILHALRLIWLSPSGEDSRLFGPSPRIFNDRFYFFLWKGLLVAASKRTNWLSYVSTSRVLMVLRIMLRRDTFFFAYIDREG